MNLFIIILFNLWKSSKIIDFYLQKYSSWNELNLGKIKNKFSYIFNIPRKEVCALKKKEKSIFKLKIFYITMSSYIS